MPRRRRPGPVVTEGVEALLTRGEALAKGWLLALVEDAPLEAAAAIMAGDLAHDGPRICDAVVHAIYAEADLRRIEPGGALESLVARAGELAGVRSAEADAHAVDTLRSVIWSALRVELARDDPEVLADAGERLSLVAELVRGAVLRRRAEGEAADDPRRRVSALRVAPTDVPAGRHPARRAADSDGGGAGGIERGGATGPDERDGRSDAAPAYDGARGPHVGDALWIGALRDEIARASRVRSSLSLLLVELDEAERMIAVEPRGEASATFGRFAQAVRTELRHRDVLACETESRAWIIARDTGRAGARALGSRIVTAVPAEGTWRGAPLTVSVGLAVLGEDGHNAGALIDAAEEMRFAAEARGIGIVTGEPGDDNGRPNRPAPDPGPDPGLAG